jgi:hypothetical protein
VHFGSHRPFDDDYDPDDDDVPFGYGGSVAAARIQDEYVPYEEDSEAGRAWEFQHSGWASDRWGGHRTRTTIVSRRTLVLFAMGARAFFRRALACLMH